MAVTSIPERSSVQLPPVGLILKVIVAIVLLAAVVVGLLRLVAWLEPVEEAEAIALRGTSTVEVRDLVATGDAAGTIEFADAAVIVHRVEAARAPEATATGTAAGSVADGGDGAAEPARTDQASTPDQIVTWLPSVGSLITNGDVFYRVNDEPTVLVIGSVPVTRSLSILSTDGPDVAQLEQFLSDGGFDPDGLISIDEDFTTATATAIERWQEEIGATITGSAELGSYAVATQPLRIAGHQASVRTTLNDGGSLLAVTSTDRLVQVELDSALAAALSSGTEVQIRLEDRSLHDGTILSVSPSRADGTVTVVAEANDGDALPSLNSLGVTLIWTDSKATAALVVPAEALIRVDQGFYAVEVVDSMTAEDARAGVGSDVATKLVPVEVGVSTGGWVEIVGTGLERGTVVVSP